MKAITYPLGGYALIQKVEKSYGLFSHIFQGIGGRMKDFIPIILLHVYNKLSHSVSVSKILETYPTELFENLGMKSKVKERSLFRGLERIGKYFPIILGRYQDFLMAHGLVDDKQIIDFSSSYFEGVKPELGKLGYSRDKRPGKLQFTYGISTGLNGVPSALTIQKGNVQDKAHMKCMLKIIKKVIPEGSLLIFDAGANTKANKKKILDMHHHYLTLKPKKVGPYKKLIEHFQRNENEVKHCVINGKNYYSLSVLKKSEYHYIYFSPELFQIHLSAKKKKFLKSKQKGNKLLKTRKVNQFPSDKGWVKLVPMLQQTLEEIDNPYLKGIEGFFILESSLNQDPQAILRLYKQRDKAEKFFRNLKEGIELRPIRHWNTDAIMGIFFICFLANLVIYLTESRGENDAPVKRSNVKCLKKSLINLSLTVAYPESGFKFTILSNVSEKILQILGDFVWNYEDKSLEMRW
jgi:transposase